MFSKLMSMSGRGLTVTAESQSIFSGSPMVLTRYLVPNFKYSVITS